MNFPMLFKKLGAFVSIRPTNVSLANITPIFSQMKTFVKNIDLSIVKKVRIPKKVIIPLAVGAVLGITILYMKNRRKFQVMDLVQETKNCEISPSRVLFNIAYSPRIVNFIDEMRHIDPISENDEDHEMVDGHIEETLRDFNDRSQFEDCVIEMNYFEIGCYYLSYFFKHFSIPETEKLILFADAPISLIDPKQIDYRCTFHRATNIDQFLDVRMGLYLNKYFRVQRIFYEYSSVDWINNVSLKRNKTALFDLACQISWLNVLPAHLSLLRVGNTIASACFYKKDADLVGFI